MEIRDLYDENRNKTGETITKGESLPPNRRIIVVIVWIQNREGKFLIQKTSEEKGSEWAATGGHLLTSETSLQAIIREVKEELGIDLSNTNIKLFDTVKREFTFVDQYYVYIDINIDDIKLQKEEVEEVKWLSIDEIKKLIDKNQFHRSHADCFYRYLDYINTLNNK